MKSIEVPCHIGMRGRFRLTCRTSEGSVTKDTGWFDNIITDQGMDWFGTTPPNYGVSYGQPLFPTHCAVGTGSTTPAYTDTRMTTFLAMYPASPSSNVEAPSSTSIQTTTSPYYISRIFTYTFPTGAAAGNLTEVGVGNCASTDTQPQLFNHALIVDGGGSPTTLTVTATEALTVEYEFRMYPSTTLTAYSFVMNSVTYSGQYYVAINNANPGSLATLSYDINGVFAMLVYNGSIGAVTGTPSGTSTRPNNTDGQGTTNSWASYTTGSYTLSQTMVIGLGAGNLPSPYITAIMLENDTFPSFQFSVSPAIPKTSSYTLSLTWNWSWSRYPGS